MCLYTLRRMKRESGYRSTERLPLQTILLPSPLEPRQQRNVPRARRSVSRPEKRFHESHDTLPTSKVFRRPSRSPASTTLWRAASSK